MARKDFEQQFIRGAQQTYAPTAQQAFMMKLREMLAEPDVQQERQLRAAQIGHINAQTAALQNPSANFYTPEQAAFVVSPSGDPEEIGKIKNNLTALHPPEKYPHGIPKDFVHQASSASRAAVTISEKQNQFDTKQFNKALEQINPYNKRNGAIGLAVQMNAKADRGIATLMKDSVSPQELSGATTDLASILKGATPDMLGEKEQSYNTILSDLQKGVQYFTGSPKNAVSPEIKAHLIQRFNELKSVNNQMLQNNLELVEAGVRPLLTNQDRARVWADAKSKLMAGQAVKAPEAAPTLAPAAGAVQPGQQPANTVDAIGSKFGF